MSDRNCYRLHNFKALNSLRFTDAMRQDHSIFERKKKSSSFPAQLFSCSNWQHLKCNFIKWCATLTVASDILFAHFCRFPVNRKPKRKPNSWANFSCDCHFFQQYNWWLCDDYFLLPYFPPFTFHIQLLRQIGDS